MRWESRVEDKEMETQRRLVRRTVIGGAELGRSLVNEERSGEKSR